ncbi:hypothetical protein [Micromonospora sp. DT31]|uniref:hypothetical protein n=1 Tax=Micromonospora sp. DT31 TaxID=3393434 RepID=UPI003CED38FA
MDLATELAWRRRRARIRAALGVPVRLEIVDALTLGDAAPDEIASLLLAGPISYDGLLVQCAGRVIGTAPDKDLARVTTTSVTGLDAVAPAAGADSVPCAAGGCDGSISAVGPRFGR